MVLILFLSLSVMRLRNAISICLLTVYTIVMAHSFIPHHHHSEFTQTAKHCEFEKQDTHSCCAHEQQTDTSTSPDKCSLDHHNQHHTHTFCSFEEKIVLNKGINLSNLFLLSIEIEYIELALNTKTYADSYFPNFIHDPHCRDFRLRGPPYFS